MLLNRLKIRKEKARINQSRLSGLYAVTESDVWYYAVHKDRNIPNSVQASPTIYL